MPLYDNFYFDQKWSLWDTWKALGRNIKGYVITTQRRMGTLMSAQKRQGNLITAQKRQGNIITGV